MQHPDRLKYPQIRRNGKLERASWDEAMDLIVERTRDVQRRLTNHGIGFYTTGQLFLEEYYTLAVVGKAGLCTLHMDGNTRLCTATAAASMRESFGSDGQPGSYTDIDFTECILMVGHNMSATQTVLWARILDRLEGPEPPTLIVIDPRKSGSAKKATLHLAPKIGTNLALLNGIQHVLFKKKYINEEYVSKHVIQREELHNVVKEYPPSKVSQITGVPEADVIRAADILGNAKSLLSTALQGVYQSNQATASACAINNINLLLGRIGRPGSGIYQMNGQPTAQNNREAGCDGEYPGFRNQANPVHMQELADLWNIDFEHVPHWNQPTHIENMLKYIQGGSIELFWINGTNPLVSLPNLQMTREILTKENLFVIVQDIFPNETTAIADVVLPAAGWGEKTGCFTNVDRTVHISHKAIDPPGEAKSDFEIFADFAKRMDFRDKDGNPLITWTYPEEAFEAWKKLSKGRPCDYSGMSYDKLTGGSGIQWPCTERYPYGKERLFDDGIFFTDLEYCESFGHDLETGAPYTKDQYKAMNPAGRAILKPCHYQPEFEAADEEYPLQLSTGRRPLHFHTRTKTGRTKELQGADPEPYIQISEKDAKKFRVKEGDFVVVESRRGKIEVAARVGLMANGQVFIPFHFGYFDDKKGRARAANELTRQQWDPVSKQPQFKSGAVRITEIDPAEKEKVHAPELQTAAIKAKEEHNKAITKRGGLKGEDKRTESFLQYWLGATYASMETLRDICDHLMSRITHSDYEVTSGMRIMHRIITSCVDRLGPITVKYRSENEYGRQTSLELKKRLFPEAEVGDISGSNAYDVLIALQSFYMFLGHVESHIIAMSPAAQATWDREFIEAVNFLNTQVGRMYAWTKQQLASRGPQTLLVPCSEAAELKDRIKDVLDTQ
ncbi:hypothetical protein LTR10_018725 [Elasticomyces elasticus]|nr:hypothetical protein LTR10_018725 [Elasticomyces elasticus]KAK5026238.1 hypothetical protein LTS07_007763 [Exophiala sideris]KAK5032491.1 hypothetical protein LTR13_007314 [Exophiala sideris]KAK5178066.1 hypothetical protein LTR44_009372 [Eurotiomycetes sp. CCFEE 6388]